MPAVMLGDRPGIMMWAVIDWKRRRAADPPERRLFSLAHPGGVPPYSPPLVVDPGDPQLTSYGSPALVGKLAAPADGDVQPARLGTPKRSGTTPRTSWY